MKPGAGLPSGPALPPSAFPVLAKDKLNLLGQTEDGILLTGLTWRVCRQVRASRGPVNIAVMNMLNRRCYGPCRTSRQRAARQGLSWLVAICTMCAVVRLQATSPGVDPALKSGRSKPGTPEFSDVFIAGKDGFKSIRIPSAVVTKKGTVLAIAEGRAQHADQANNKLILKRSADGGRTWGARQIIADDGANCLNNPCAVVDDRTGRIIVMYQSYPGGLQRARRQDPARPRRPGHRAQLRGLFRR